MLDERTENTVADATEEPIEATEYVSPLVKGFSCIASLGASLRSAAILHIAKKLNHPESTGAKTAVGKAVKSVANVGAHIEIAKMGCDFINRKFSTLPLHVVSLYPYSFARRIASRICPNPALYDASVKRILSSLSFMYLAKNLSKNDR